MTSKGMKALIFFNGMYFCIKSFHIFKISYKDSHVGGIYSQKQRLKTTVFIIMDLFKANICRVKKKTKVTDYSLVLELWAIFFHFPSEL